MPSEIMDRKEGLSSSSFFSEDVPFSSERQVGFWKADSISDRHAVGRAVVLSPLENHLTKSLEHHQSFLTRDQKTENGFDRHIIGAERTMSRSFNLLRPVDHDLGFRMNLNANPTSILADGSKVNGSATQYENSLFSSSLSELFSEKLRLSANNALYGHSIDGAASHFEEEEPLESLEELEALTLGDLLPSNEDLFTGVTERQDNVNQQSVGDDMEDLDFFSSVGGMDLGEDGSASQIDPEFPGGISNGQLGVLNGSITGEHPYGEHPSRTLFVRNINSNVEDSELKVLFEQYGDIRSLYTSCKQRGFVMISYYDIRAATNAMKALQNRPLRRRKLDIHYSIPKDNPSEKDVNQGTLVVFNLDSAVSNDELLQIFGVYGEIKEIRETPQRNHHKFVEFYDIRAAEAALHALNRSDIAGKQIKIEPSRPGGSRRCLLQQIPPEGEQDDAGSYIQSSPPNNLTTGFSGTATRGVTNIENGTISGLPSGMQAPFLESPFRQGISSGASNGLPSFMRAESAGKQAGLAVPNFSQNQFKVGMRATSNLHPHSLPEYHDSLSLGIGCNSPGTRAASINLRPPERIDNRQLPRIATNGYPVEFNDGVFRSASHGSCSLPGHQYTWGNSYHPQPPGMMWPSSPSLVNGLSVAPISTQLHGPSRGLSPMMDPVLTINNQHVGSAPAVNPSLWDRQHAYATESPEASGFHPGSLGSMRIANNLRQSIDFVSPNVFSQICGNSMELPVASKSTALQSHHQRSMMFPGRGGQMIPMINAFDPPNERSRSRRNEGSISQADKKQYELDIDRIFRGEDSRTTLMIKNIPNKYTSKMLLAAIDEHHKGTYDFIYLPIDFKNKCNVGYAFINMIDPCQIIPFYQAFNGKKWEKFNSEKVASLAYARIQGKAALIAHFQNSSLMNEDKRCRPILFNTDGPNAGDQVPFPMGVNVRTRPGKFRTINNEDNQVGSPPHMASSENSSSGSGKESD